MYHQQWNGVYFTITSLKQLGLRIQLGHPLGQRCANPAAAFNNDFVIIDTDAIHSVSLDFCNCHLARPHNIQLLRAQLFPATVDHPKTAATFRVLKHFQLLSFVSKVSNFEFYYAISRRTDNTGTNPPPVNENLFSVYKVLNIFCL
jgi:CxC2 like cysteine cluster associated with KDZ transposases